jgi:signal transduction histidine kinase/ligand-binding sensor domain-containing protein
MSFLQYAATDKVDAGIQRLRSKSRFPNFLTTRAMIFFALLSLSNYSYSQTEKERGYPLIDNYSSKEYNWNTNIWAMLQDERGIVYFGNDLGLFQFDGISLELYQLPNKSVVRSLAKSDDGKIYCGGQAELGYFQPDASGKLQYHSLLKFIPSDKKGFADVFQTYVNNGKVYFNASKYIFIWDIQTNTFKIIQSENTFHLMFKVRGSIYVREWGKGLEVLKADSLILLKGGEKFANERIYIMLPFPDDEQTTLIGTRTMGLFKYDGNNFISFKTEADQFLKNSLIYYPGAVLSDGNIVLGTVDSGAVIINPGGKELGRYSRDNGLVSNAVFFTLQDESGAIWMGTDAGVSRIDYSSPVTYFDSRNNLFTNVNDLLRYNKVIYIAGNNGVYYLDSSTSDFHLLNNSNSQSFYLLSAGTELLAATNEGLCKIGSGKLSVIRKTIGTEYYAYVLARSTLNPKRIYVGNQSGLWSVLQTGSGWKDEGQLLSAAGQKTSIVEDNDGSLWISTLASGAFHIIFAKSERGDIVLDKSSIEHFDRANGLEEGQLYISRIDGVNYFTTPDSIYKFDNRRKIFYSDTSDKMIAAFYKLADGKTVNFFQPDSLGRLWLGTNSTLGMGTRSQDGTYDWTTAPFKRFANERINEVYAEKNGITWFFGSSSVIAYNFTKKNTNTGFSALVRNVDIGGDSTIYFGQPLKDSVTARISFDYNSVKFRFSATSYEGKNSNIFKTFLSGFDKSWSSWSAESTKEYTNLPPGNYSFMVIAQNIVGTQSTTGTYSFEILPPWYRTWWAYVCYPILLVLGAIGFARTVRRRAISKEREHAELREAKLKADAENERRKNIELISEMGKDITASLSIEHIIDTVYLHVNKLMDASVFGIGIVNKDKHILQFPATKEKGETLKGYSYDLDDATRPASWCFNNKTEIFINDFGKEHQLYITDIPAPAEGENAESIIYLPLIYKNKTIGVITAQSFSKNAYSEYHLNILRSLATYTALALDNADAYRALQSVQTQLIQTEKMASLGELTAGIAHEIQNPLNFVNNFSEVNGELIEELQSERSKVSSERDDALQDEIINDLKQNLEKINHHGKRADAIVKGMLQHSRVSTGQKEITDINALCDEYLRLCYQGLRAKDRDFNTDIRTDFDEAIGKINIIPQDIGRVLLNLFNNAFYAVNEKKKSGPLSLPINRDRFEGGTSKLQNEYTPLVTVRTKLIPPLEGKREVVEIRVADNANGIPQNIVDKIFQPFFTTKPTGQGTGLGLSLAYDIIKAHGGEIKVETKESEGSEFFIQLPISQV